MKRVLVDTTVWSLALRRGRGKLSPDERRIELAVHDLIRHEMAATIGVIRLEVLSGVKSDREFEELRLYLRNFEDEPLEPDDYEQAARFYNTCRSRGVAGTHVDLLICAVAHRHGFEIFTIDEDFRRYAEHLPIALHSPREAQA